MAVDFDIVAHELSHHVIYKTLLANNPQSLAIHEGLADFFTYAETGDRCLAESLCAQGQPNCYLPGQCLRSTDIDARLEYRNDPHQQGQIISAMLWGLRDDWGYSRSEVTQLVYEALEILPPHAGYYELGQALLYVGEHNGGNTYACAIVEIFQERGINLGQECSLTPTKLTDGEVLPAEITPNACAAIGGYNSRGSLFLLALPLLVALWGIRSKGVSRKAA